MNCTKCNAPVPNDAAFCPECGAAVEAPAAASPSRLFCPNCGTELQAGDVFCGNCGTSLGAPARTKPAHTPKKVNFDFAKNLKEKLPPIKNMRTVLAVVAAILVLAILLPVLFSGGSDNYAIYIKDNQLQYGELPKLKDVQEITNKLLDGYDLEDVSYPQALRSYIYMSDDGNKLFYPDRVEFSNYGYVNTVTLYCRQINKPDKEPVKIDSGITTYKTNKDGTMVYYIKNGNLYQNDLEEKTKIDGDVSTFYLSEDEKTLVYLTTSDEADGSTTKNLYLVKNGKDPEKILSGISDLERISSDFKTIIFVKNESLYVMYDFDEPVKIASHVSSVLQSYDSGEVYYVTQDEEELTYWDFINNDMADSDYAEYYADSLKSYTMRNPLRTLHYYDGEESVVITENMVDWSYHYGNRAVQVYSNYEEDELPKQKLSEYIDSYTDLSSWVYEEMIKDTVSCIAIGGVSEELEIEDFYDVEGLANDGSVLYCTADYNPDEYTSSVYKITLSKNSVESCELVDDDVSRYSCRIFNDSVLYIKDGELYMDGKFIDDDVYSGYMLLDVENDKVYYMQDWNSNKQYGTLMCYNMKESVTIKDDVSDVMLAPDGSVLFLYDYNINHLKGELWILDGKKATKLDDDVSYILLAK